MGQTRRPRSARPHNGHGARPRFSRISFPSRTPKSPAPLLLNRPVIPLHPSTPRAAPQTLATAALKAQTEHSAAGKKLCHGILQRRRDSDLSDPVAQSQVHLEATRGTREPGNASAPTPP